MLSLSVMGHLRGEKGSVVQQRVTYQHVPGSVLSSLLYIIFEVSEQSDEPFTSPLQVEAEAQQKS